MFIVWYPIKALFWIVPYKFLRFPRFVYYFSFSAFLLFKAFWLNLLFLFFAFGQFSFLLERQNRCRSFWGLMLCLPGSFLPLIYSCIVNWRVAYFSGWRFLSVIDTSFWVHTSRPLRLSFVIREAEMKRRNAVDRSERKSRRILRFHRRQPCSMCPSNFVNYVLVYFR